MTIKKTLTTLGATTFLLGGGIALGDQAIDPYITKPDSYELTIVSAVPEAGDITIESLKSEPKVILRKWDGQVAMGVKYDKLNSTGDRAFLSNKIEWKGQKEEVHAYPLQGKAGMEDGGFEIELILKEKPQSNVFDFTIDGAENLNFYYQDVLSPEEISEGVIRPENVIGSYAVYHKEKANHEIGKTNYATGKAYHIYRPKVTDAEGSISWAELSYKNGKLTVTVPQMFLDLAVYPIVVDPTFGYTTTGGSDCAWFGRFTASTYTAPANGDVTSISAYANSWSTSGKYVFGIYNGGDNTSSPLMQQTAEQTSGSNAFAWRTVSLAASATVVSGNSYTLAAATDNNMDNVKCDLSPTPPGRSTSRTYSATLPDPYPYVTNTGLSYSIYATYTTGGGVVSRRVLIIE